ncbi:hypothetical protein CI610_00250 [invertebrate metagenome]|uniref:SCP2 domain-containing protein n=1 Tax=invertebrate metagenome TaxID=1711999 RepID=A0A2H9TBZ2_9ZZZZ
MKFKLLLWTIGFLMRRESRKNPAFREKLKGENIAFQIRSEEGVARHYVVCEQKVFSSSGKLDQPVFEIAFKNNRAGFRALTAGNAQLAFMKGIQTQNIVINGDYKKVLWFQKLMGSLVSGMKKRKVADKAKKPVVQEIDS